MRAAWEKVYPKAARHPKHHTDIEQHIAQNNPRHNPNPYALDMGPYGSGVLPVNRRNPGGSVKISRFPGECIVCGGEMKGTEVVDSGQRGPKGGKKMQHVSCG